MPRILAIFFSFFLFSSFAFHEYYVSVAEGKFDEKTRTLQFSIKFIGHDLEKALEITGVPDLKLGTSSEHPNANEYILKYINSKFVISVNNTPIRFKIIGKEVNNDDDIFCYIESEKITEISKINISNNLLIEVFSGQENIVNLMIFDKKISTTFNYEKTNDSFSL